MKAVLLFACASLAACSVFTKQGPTDVARGEYYAAGKPAFDSFFIQLHELQVELLAAPAEPQRARRSLAQGVGLTPDASDESLQARLQQELKKLENQGLRVRLEVPESTAADASATLHTSDSALTSPLRSQLPQEATRLVRSRNRMLAIHEQLEKLRVTGIQLEGSVDVDFRTDGPWKRDEVRRNLSDGQKLITLMQARAKEVADQARSLLAQLSSSVSTDPNLGKVVASPPPQAQEAPAKLGRRPAPRAGSSRPAPATATPAQPAPAVSKPRAEDEAAAKPVQGSAPAEIEP